MDNKRQVRNSTVDFLVFTKDAGEDGIEVRIQDIVEENIRNLSGRGIYFSLDDYGTGYSNLSRMMSLPFHLIKPDKSLVDKLDEDNMQLTEMGCDYIQGYYFSRPLPKQEFVDFIQNSSKVDEVEHHSLI